MKRSWWLAILLASHEVAVADILDYVAAPDPSYAWSVGQPGPAGVVNLSLTSQTWQQLPWRHTVTVIRPTEPKYPDLCVLFITGGSYGPKAELMMGQLLANSLGCSFAVLWDIPNQPLWEMREDDLIAHTFVKAIETGDQTWPLLFPMTKSAVRAMDALQAWSRQAYGAEADFDRFICAGASKRGWTTWFTAVVDPRVKAILPLVYDNLNVAAQMTHQMALWGAYSPMIEDYTRRGLQAQLETPAGSVLAKLIDPFTYRDKLALPKLIINGTNDAYWTIDALNLYRDQLPGVTHQLYVPNSGHGLEDVQKVLGAASGFVRLIAAARPLPELGWEVREQGEQLLIKVTAPGAESARVWQAVGEAARFTKATWTAQPLAQDGEAWVTLIDRRVGECQALFAEATFQVEGQPMPLSTTLKLFPAKP